MITIQEQTQKQIASQLDEAHRLLFEWLLESHKVELDEARTGETVVDDKPVRVAPTRDSVALAPAEAPAVALTLVENEDEINAQPAAIENDPRWVGVEDRHCEHCGTVIPHGNYSPLTYQARRFCKKQCFDTWQRSVKDPHKPLPDEVAVGESDGRLCGACKKPIVRKTRASGGAEAMANFLQRKYCDSKCAGVQARGPGYGKDTAKTEILKPDISMNERVLKLWERFGNVAQVRAYITTRIRPSTEEIRSILNEAGIIVAGNSDRPAQVATSSALVVHSEVVDRSPAREVGELEWPAGLQPGPVAVKLMVEALAQGHTAERVARDYNMPIEQLERIKSVFKSKIEECAELKERVARQLFLDAFLTRLREAHAAATGNSRPK